MSLKKVLVLASFLQCFLSINANGQDFFKSDYFSNYIPRNPEKASLGTFGNTPINYYTGLPEVSLKILTLPSRELNLPISLNYDASGIRSDELASSVGMKWHLNAGGYISRELVGLPDEHPSEGYFKYALQTDYYENLGNVGDWVNWAEKNDRDRGPDEFVINVSGRSIRFIFDKYRRPIPIPHQNVKITYTSLNNKINGFELITEDGTKYTFGAVAAAIEETKIERLLVKFKFGDSWQDTYTTYVDQGNFSNEFDYDYFLKDPQPALSKSVDFEEKSIDFFNSKWYLTSIISPTDDNISFSYSKGVNTQYTLKPGMVRVWPLLVKMATYTWDKLYCEQPSFLGCISGKDKVRTRTRTLQDGSTFAIAKFGKTTPGVLPDGISANMLIDQSNTSLYFPPQDFTATLGSVQADHTLITQSSIRLTQILTAAGNKVTFYTTSRTDLPNTFKYETISLYDMNNVIVKTFKLNYNIVNADETNDLCWISEATMLSTISNLGSLNTFFAKDVKANFIETNVPDAKYRKYVFEGLKDYNYKRLWLESVEEDNNIGMGRLLYEFEYQDRSLLKRRTSPLHDAYGFSRSTANGRSFTIQTGKTAMYTNGEFPGSNLHDGRQPLRGLLKKIKYPTKGCTEFEYISSIGPKVKYVRDKDQNNAVLHEQELEYVSSSILKSPVNTSYQESKMKDTNDWMKYVVTTTTPQNDSYSTTQGTLEGNRIVKVYNGTATANKGYEVFTFYGTTDSSSKDISTLIMASPVDEDQSGTLPGGITDAFPFPKAYERDYLRGLLLNKKTYTSSNQLLSEFTNNYTVNPNGYVPKEIKGLKAGSYVWSISEKTTFMYGRQPVQNHKYRYARYKIIPDWVVLDNTIEKRYDEGLPQDVSKFVENKTEYKYDLKDLMQIETKKYNNLVPTDFVTVKTKFPTHTDYDFYSTPPVDCEEQYNNCMVDCANEPDPQVQAYCYSGCPQQLANCTNSPGISASPEVAAVIELRNKHQFALPVEVQNWVQEDGQSKLISAVVYKYSKEGTGSFFIRPKEVWGLNRPLDLAAFASSKANADGSFGIDSKMRKLHTFNLYDQTFGNIIRQTNLDGTVSDYTWGFNNSLVTSHTVNPGALQHQNSYVHQPLVGLLRNLDPNNLKTDFEYDLLERLSKVKDNDGNIVSRYRYHYVSQNEDLGSTLTASNPRVVGTAVNFSSQDPIPYQASSSITYKWDFGDQTGTTTTGYGASHVYNAPGQYTITVNKSHPEMNPVTATTTINITPPLVLTTCGVGPVTIDLCQQISPVPGTCTTGSITINSPTTIKANISGGCGSNTYSWDFQFNGGPWQGLGSGIQVVAPPGFTNRTIGNYNVRCTVTDSCGNTKSVTLLLAIFKTNPSC